MKTFKDWLNKVEKDIAAEVSSTTADVAGNPYGAGIQHYNSDRDQFGIMKKCKEDKSGRCGLGNGLAGGVRGMKFSSGRTVHDAK